MKKNITLLFLTVAISLNSQSLWKDITTNKESFSKEKLSLRKSNLTKYNLFSLNVNDFKNSLNSVTENRSKVISLPFINGKLQRFSIKENSNFEAALQSKFVNIRSYSAQGIDDPTAVAKISIGTDGVHVMIMSGNHSTFYIDPYTKDNKNYIAYERANLVSSTDVKFQCDVDEELSISKKQIQNINFARNADDGNLRTFRLALACTVEYSQFHLTQQGVPASATEAVKKAAVLSAMNTSMARVNSVYERDLGVRMTIITGNEDIIFIDSDNLDNSNTMNALLNQIQGVIDGAIGNTNYDIGHVFSTGGGGVATLGIVCNTSLKARGVTGTNNPINDPFDIDFVAHEMGHQFGATHTQNNSCQRTLATAVEPGSASTIMGYAGICAPNVQNNSDDHFNAISIDQMWATIQSSATCATVTNLNNAAPVITTLTDVSIPKSTPFVLRGEATDADGNGSLTYNWEQQDNEVASMPPLSTNTGGPAFRSLSSTASPDRYMPALPTVIGGSTSSTWEVVPSVARTMNFSLVVRDNNAGGGNSARDDIQVTVTDAEPFLVTSQNTAVTWNTGSSQTITWDKSTTDVAPINTANVKIKLSIDGGATFPITLVESTPNDGTHTLTVPNNPTTQARIMVEAVDNVFYNVNATNFTINSTTPTFVLANNTAQQEACNTGGNTVSYTLNLDFVNGFSENVTFSTTNEPAGSTIAFSPSSISADGDVTVTVSNFDGATAQLYTIQITGTSTSVNQSVDALLLVLGDSFSPLSLTAPADASTDISIAPNLTWNADSNASSYDVEVSSDSGFATIVASGTVTTNSYTVSPALSGTTTYFWRVKPKNDCGEGAFSTAFSFTTANPVYCASTHSEATGSEWISNVTFNTINNDSGNDYENNTDGTQDGYEDFTNLSTMVDVGTTQQISVTFDTAGFQDHVYVFIDWNQDFVFDLTNERYDVGSFTDDVVTATFDIPIPNDATLGNTRMRVVLEYDDPTNNFGEGPCTANYLTGWGETEDYTIEVNNPTASVDDFNFGNFSLYPNPSNGEVNLSFNVIDTDNVNIQLYDLRGRKISENKFNNVTSQFSERLTFDSISSGIYLLRISNGGKQTTKKIIIE